MDVIFINNEGKSLEVIIETATYSSLIIYNEMQHLVYHYLCDIQSPTRHPVSNSACMERLSSPASSASSC
jgi:hypothetical protein